MAADSLLSIRGHDGHVGVGAGSTKANSAPPRGPGYTRQGVRGVGGGVTVIVKLHTYGGKADPLSIYIPCVRA